MKQNEKRQPKFSTLITIAGLLTSALILSVTVYAWFTNRRALDTMTRVSSPTSLCIGAGAKEDSANIDMGGIDVTDPAEKKNFVFCVYSDDTAGSYKLQLAHTTNIDFTYKIYKAQESEGTPIAGDSLVVYYDEENLAHYYIKDSEAIAGRYLNQDGSDPTIADKSLHDFSYDEYVHVQKNAEPLYWQNTDPIEHQASELSFVDYYILEVSWDSTKVSNDKETDMVYLTAGMV
ncbi:MAG: hypothetical protein ACI4Q4_09155 [Oscillospiraceae bacterium]